MTQIPVRAEQPPLVLALRLAALRDPAATAARIVGSLTKPRAAAPPLRTDLQVLLAEVLHQCGERDTAINAAAMAAETAATITPLDWPRLFTTLLVGADLALCAGHPNAVDACASACNAVTNLVDPEQERATIAHALHAVAVHHHLDRAQGRQQLSFLRKSVPTGSLVEQTVIAGLAAMHTGRAGLGHGLPVPLPSGVLQPHLDVPTIGWLADRVRNTPQPGPAATS